MINIANLFADVLLPQKAIVLYRHLQRRTYHVEAFDMDQQGYAINPHCLSSADCALLSKALQIHTKASGNFMQPKAMLNSKVLFLNKNSLSVIWYTPARKVPLLFDKKLRVTNAAGAVPPLLWKATPKELHIYALHTSRRPRMGTPLYHAPFFNTYSHGKVCMGTVNIRIQEANCLEDFMAKWEDYFFNSYFSHMIKDVHPVKGSLTQLWQHLVSSGEAFPADVLKPNGLTIKDVL